MTVVRSAQSRPGNPQRDETKDTTALRALAAMLVIGVAVGVALWRIDGPPRLSSGLPNGVGVRELLTRSNFADADVIAVTTTVAWCLLGYLALTIGLRLIATLADRMTGGTRWTRAGLRLSTLVTIPAIRRIVDGGVAGALLLATMTPTRGAFAAESAAPPPPAISQLLVHRTDAIGHEPEHERSSARSVLYTVLPDESMWDIARRVYGDGSRYIDVFDANRGRLMTDGTPLVDPRIVRPGWVLELPLPAENVPDVDGVSMYRVREGDDLWGIASRFLGDGFRWVEIWEHNAGREMAGGWRFTDANIIHPGWLLELPVGLSGEAGTVDTRNAAPAPTSPFDRRVPDPTSTPGSSRLSDPATQPDSGRRWNAAWPSVPPAVAVSAAGFVLIAGIAIFVERLRRAGAFVLRARGASGRDRGIGDAGRVAVASRAVASALADYDFANALPQLVSEGGSRLQFTVACAFGDAEALVRRQHDLARRLACNVEARALTSTRVELTLRDFQRLAGELVSDRASRVLMVPMGADGDGIIYLNLAAAGSVAVVGTAAERKKLLRSWLAMLTTTCAPDEVAFRPDSSTAASIEEALALPHFVEADPAADSANLGAELEEAVHARMSDGGPRHALIGLANLTESGAELPDSVLRHGASVGIVVIGAFSPEAPAHSLERFATSVRLGDDGAAGSSDGTDTTVPFAEVTLRIGGDEPLRLDAVRVRRDTSPRWVTDLASVPIPDVQAEAGDGAESSFVAVPELATTTIEAEPVQLPATPSPSPSPSPTPTPTAMATAVGDVDERAQPETDTVSVSAAVLIAPPRDQGSLPPQCEGVGEGRCDTELAIVSPRAQVTTLHQTPAVRDEHRDVARQSALFAADELLSAGTSQTASSPTVQVQCFGSFELSFDGAPITHWPLEKARELLAFLLAHGGSSVSREVVAEALWPDLGWDASVKHMLANAASTLRGVLRSACGDSELQPLVTARQRYHLQPALFRTDLDTFDAALQRARTLPPSDAMEAYERALAMYRGDFLEREVFSWAEPYRIDYRERMITAARHGAAIAFERGESRRAVAFYQAILEREPIDEEAARGLMRSLAAAGDPNGARKIYRVLAAALQTELDDPRVVPAPETRAMLAEIVGETSVA